MTGHVNPPLFEANGCLHMAGNRLQDARALLWNEEGSNQGCCFSSHQTAEMSLKGLIWYYTKTTPERTHSLHSLLETLEKSDLANHPAFPSLMTSISVMENHYMASRYEYEYEHGNFVSDYTRQEAEDSVAAATHIYEVARSVVPAWESGGGFG